MKGNLKKLWSLITLLSFVIILENCGSDDEATPPTVNFQTATRTVGEGAGVVEVSLQLNEAAPKNISVRYSLSGTAVEGTTSSADYKVVGKYGEITILEGATSGAIQLEIKQDALVEPNETIIIEIDEVVSNAAKIGETSLTTITIENDDVGAEANFKLTSLTAVESDGLLEIEVQLDKTMPQDIIITYELSGSAIDSLTAWDEEIPADYYIDGISGELLIESGNTSGIIKLMLYTDLFIEDGNPSTAALDPETIIITLTGGTNSTIVGTKNTMTISLKQQDGRAVLLEWDESYTTVDMDMFLWMGEDVNSFFFLDFSINASFDPPELLFIPDNLPSLVFESPDAVYGFSYTYWGGNVEPMNFTVTFIDIVNSVVEGAANRDVFNGSYTLANINEWDNQTTGITPIVVQTMEKSGGAYTISSITIPGAGSRTRNSSVFIPKHLKKSGTNSFKKVY